MKNIMEIDEFTGVIETPNNLNTSLDSRLSSRICNLSSDHYITQCQVNT